MTETYVIIEKEDGAQASVIESEFQKHYPDVKYRVLGEETPAAFSADVPKPKKDRPKPTAKTGAPLSEDEAD